MNGVTNLLSVNAGGILHERVPSSIPPNIGLPNSVIGKFVCCNATSLLSIKTLRYSQDRIISVSVSGYNCSASGNNYQFRVISSGKYR